ncbi:MAG: leucine-rich repeat domain-containing protein, partial [Treponemataceae bacterium]|nr:leucine-rich repeat domain-containing protein [Treponemataceae bacterium]
TGLLAAGFDNVMTGAVAAVVTGQQNGTGSNHAPSMPDGEIDDDGVLTKYTGNETDVTIPEGVTDIGSGAFYECESLETVTYNGTLAQWCAMDNDFWLMHNATSVILTGQNNMNLKQEATLVIPDEATKIGRNAFGGCTSLTGVTIPEGVTSIGNNAFYECTSLTEVTIPDGVTKIEYNTFYGCASLTSVTIPDGVTSIESSTFEGCTGLTTINYTGTEEDWNAITKDSSWDNNTGDYKITYNYKE